MKKFAIGYIGKKGLSAYYFGDSLLVENVLAHYNNKGNQNIYSETYVTRYYDTENDMMNYINERANFLSGTKGIEFHDLRQSIAANM